MQQAVNVNFAIWRVFCNPATLIFNLYIITMSKYHHMIITSNIEFQKDKCRTNISYYQPNSEPNFANVLPQAMVLCLIRNIFCHLLEPF